MLFETLFSWARIYWNSKILLVSNSQFLILLNFSYKQFVLILINLCLSFKNILVPFYFRYVSWKQCVFRLCLLIQFENLCTVTEKCKLFVLQSNILSSVLHLLKNIFLVLWNVAVFFSFICSSNGKLQSSSML